MSFVYNKKVDQLDTTLEPKDKQEAVQAIAQLTAYAKSILDLAAKIADDHKVSFELELGLLPEMEYMPRSVATEEYGDRPLTDGEHYGWLNSSMRC